MHAIRRSHLFRQFERGQIGRAALFNALGENPEFESVLSPLLEAIESTYERLLFRSPTPRETAACVRRFFRAMPSPADRQRAAAAGDLLVHVGIRPLKVEMDVVNQCNIRCRMCHFDDPAYSYKARPKVEVSIERFESIARQIFPFCSELSLSISTEPLLHEGIEDLLEIMARYKVPWTYMHTNALLLDARKCKKLVDSGIDQLSISIDGATAGVYEGIRKGARLDRLISNIEMLQATKLRMGVRRPKLAFNVVLMRSNVHELPEIVRLAARLGVEAVAACHVVPLNEEMAGETLDKAPQAYDEARAAALLLGGSCGVSVEIPPPFEVQTAELLPTSEPEEPADTGPHRDLRFVSDQSAGPPTSACAFPWHFLGLDTHGNVSPCGWWHRQPFVGNVHDEPFLDVWNGERYRKLREEHRAGELRDICRSCPASGMGSVHSSEAFAVR